jgi:hypothetical protein
MAGGDDDINEGFAIPQRTEGKYPRVRWKKGAGGVFLFQIG